MEDRLAAIHRENRQDVEDEPEQVQPKREFHDERSCSIFLKGNEFELQLKTGRIMLGVLEETTVDDAKDKVVRFVNAQLDSGAVAVVVVRGPVPDRHGAYFVDLSFFGGDQDIRLTDWLRDNHLIYQ